MKEVYDIDSGVKRYAFPNRRDTSMYDMPARTTVVTPPPYDSKTEEIRYREGQWRIYKIGDTHSFRTFSENQLDPMILLREERNQRLAAIDSILESYEAQGLSIPNHWIDYRSDLRNVPQHVEFGFVSPPQIVGGKLIFNDWPQYPI